MILADLSSTSRRQRDSNQAITASGLTRLVQSSHKTVHGDVHLRLGNVQRDFSQRRAAPEQPEVVFSDKANPSEEAEKEAEVACEVQQEPFHTQFIPKLRFIFRAVTMTFCFAVLFFV